MSKFFTYLFLAILVLSFSNKLAAQWNADPNVNNPIVNGANLESLLDVCSDGAGGTIFIYYVNISSNTVLRAQRMSAAGNKLWGTNGVDLVTIDLAAGIFNAVIKPVSGGGVIVSFVTQIAPAINLDVYAQRLDANGVKLWNAGNPVVVCNATGGQLNVRLAVFADASSVMTWEDQRLISGSDNRSNIYAQKLNAAGATQWTANGVVVSLAVQDQIYPQILPINNGGNNETIIVWEDYRTDPLNPDIYGQRLDANGVRQWPGGGITGAIICNAPGPQYRPLICTDGGTGAIVAWRDDRVNGFIDIYSVRIDIDGVSNTDWWDINGIIVSQTGRASTLNNLEFIDNKIVYVWNETVPNSPGNFDLRAHALDIEATNLWYTIFPSVPGITVSDAPLGQEESRIQPDGAGGVVVVWLDRRVLISNYRHVYAQRISATGVPQWTANGKPVATINANKQKAFVITNGCTSIFMWDDWRTSGSTSVDIYATSFDCNGNVSNVGGAASGDYRSTGTGSWGSLASWQRFDGANWIAATDVPTNADGIITIQSGHTITANTAITADQVVVDNGGTLSIVSDFDFTLSNGSGDDLTVSGTLSWTRGAIAGAGNIVINAGGTMNLVDGFFKTLSPGLTNNGTINWQDGIVSVISGNATTNIGSINITGSTNRLWSSPSAAFNNNGTINHSNTEISTVNANPFSNAGTINFNAGTLTNNAVVWNNTGNLNFSGSGIFNLTAAGGAFNVNTGSLIGGSGLINNTETINLNTALVLPASINFTSNNTIQGAGDLTINQNFTIEGAIQGSGALILNGTQNTWRSNILGRSLTIAAGQTLNLSDNFIKTLSASLTNNGTINWQDGIVIHNTGNTVTNNGTLNITGSAIRSWNSNSATFVNNGIIANSNTGTTSFVASVLTNSTTGIIRGTGTIINDVTVFNSNGVIAPGLSPGLLTINNAQPLSANSTLQIEMQDGSGAGTGHDQLIRNGDLTLAGILTVTEIGNVPNGTYTIVNLTSGAISGNFATTNLPAGYTIQVNPTNVQITKSGGLPVNFISFTANRINNGNIELKWVTENEVNNKHFEVQRSKSGGQFETIGLVNAIVSPDLTKHYRFTDAQPLPGNSYYRLKQVDIDGKFEYSVTKRVLVRDDLTQLSVYPNPSRDRVIVTVSSEGGYLQLIDIYGRRLLTQRLTSTAHSLSLGNYSNGAYWLVYEKDGNKTVQQIIKQ